MEELEALSADQNDEQAGKLVKVKLAQMAWQMPSNPLARRFEYNATRQTSFSIQIDLLVLSSQYSAHMSKISRGNRHFTVGGGRLRQSGPRPEMISLRSVCTRILMDFITNGFSSKIWPEQIPAREAAAEAACTGDGGVHRRRRRERLATSLHDPLGITDSAYKNQLFVVSVQYGPFNPYIPIRSTTIGKSRVAKDLIAMRTSWRSNSDIASVTSIGYPRMSASGESSTMIHRLLHASGSHPIPPPNDPLLCESQCELWHSLRTSPPPSRSYHLANFRFDISYLLPESFRYELIPNPYCSSYSISFDCRRFTPSFGARLVALSSSFQDLFLV
ncbi:hypothetical protein F511_16626 [Dorcoceras hygrometricum]|uniref:Uncharacterized protein n=1 Tax=Dorcoceras hygrometricum TaxID=472368 RepID=A0A2Z7BQQ7_9LAMI|nr:hypothetical protein F511_16626 [Dorcoceras hygrometricum]